MAQIPAPPLDQGEAITTRLPRLATGDRPAWLLAAALAAAILYAAFASGATAIPEESKLQIGIAVIALGTVAALLFGQGLRLDAPGLGRLGLGLLVAFAAWVVLSFSWSIAPDGTWVEANRAVSYTLVAGLALVLGSSLPRPVERIAFGYLAIATFVALYSLGGKLIPGFNVPGLFDLNHTELFSRLRAPLEYWNALAIFCVLAIPVGLRAAADPDRGSRLRMVALLAIVPLLATAVLTYSRGGLLALLIGLAVLVVLSADRLRLLTYAALAALAAVPALLVALIRSDLTTDSASLDARTGDGLMMLAALLLGLALCFLVGRALMGADHRIELTGERRRQVTRALLGAGAVALLALVIGLAVSDRGLTGTIDHELDSFTKIQEDRQNDPSRVLQTNSGNRWVWWQEATGAWWDRPLVGHGAGSFPLLHRAYRDNGLEVKQPHSVPLEFLSETGLIGAVLGLGGLLLLGAAGMRRWGGSLAGPDRLYTTALLSALSAWAIHMCIDWDWDIPAVTLPGLVFLGVLAARPGAPAPQSGRAIGPRAVALAAATVVGVAAIMSALLPALADDHVDDAFALTEKGGRENLKKAAKEASLARRIDPFSVEPLLAEATIAERRNRPRQAFDALAEAAERQPDNPLVWSRLARFQLLADDSPGAFRSIRFLRQLDSRQQFAGILLLQALYDEGSSASATGTPLPEVAGAPVPGTVPGQTPGTLPQTGQQGTGAGGAGGTGQGTTPPSGGTSP